MFWADTTATPTNDSVEITHLHGLPLYFETVQGCSDHIDQNIDALKEYGIPYVRGDDDYPWSYELIYFQFLFQWGIFICLIYMFGFYFIYKNLRKIFMRKHSYGPYAISAFFGNIGKILKKCLKNVIFEKPKRIERLILSRHRKK